MFNRRNKTKKNKKIIFIYLLVLAVIITIFGIVYYNNIQSQKSPESPEITKLRQFLVENCKEFEIPKVNTLTWKTFYDKENGFKFKYPRGWVVEKSDRDIWGFKEILSIRNPEDDEPCSQPKGCWDESRGDINYITHDVVSFNIFSSANLKNNLRTESADYSKPTVAVDDGIVVESFDDSAMGYGNRITIDHENGFSSSYVNMESRSVEVGDIVKKGQEIGKGETMDFKKDPKTKNINLIDSFINSTKERLEKKEGDVFYGFIGRYIYIYHDDGYFIFSDSNDIILISKGYFDEKKEEYNKIYHGIVKTLKIY